MVFRACSRMIACAAILAGLSHGARAQTTDIHTIHKVSGSWNRAIHSDDVVTISPLYASTVKRYFWFTGDPDSELNSSELKRSKRSWFIIMSSSNKRSHAELRSGEIVRIRGYGINFLEMNPNRGRLRALADYPKAIPFIIRKVRGSGVIREGDRIVLCEDGGTYVISDIKDKVTLEGVNPIPEPVRVPPAQPAPPRDPNRDYDKQPFPGGTR